MSKLQDLYSSGRKKRSRKEKVPRRPPILTKAAHAMRQFTIAHLWRRFFDKL
jgi:hypothetical protein